MHILKHSQQKHTHRERQKKRERERERERERGISGCEQNRVTVQ